MDTSARVLNLLIRALGTGALALGLAFWSGYARSLTQLHIVLGIGLVLSVWVVSWIAWRKTGRGGLPLLGAACGIVSLPFGVAQGAILPGALHWVVELAHLAVGVILIGVGSRLAAAVSHRRVSASPS
jgi:hypothetical protein